MRALNIDLFINALPFVCIKAEKVGFVSLGLDLKDYTKFFKQFVEK
jgi:hypothetical protein